MVSRSNLSGRKGGFGRGPLSKVYGKARKLAAGARKAGRPPGDPATGGGALSKIKAAAQKRGGFRGMRRGAQQLAEQAAGERGMGTKAERFLNERTIQAPGQVGEMKAPGQEDLTGGGPLVTPAVMPGQAGIGAKLAAGIKARQAPPTPDISLNRMPRKRRAAGAMTSRRQPVIDHAAIAPAAQLTPQLPGVAAGTPAQPPQTDAANIGVSEAANIPTANAPGARSVRSRGLNRRV